MKPGSLRAAVNERAVWELLTPNQRMVLRLATTPTEDGRRRCVKGLCKGLGINRSSFYRTLRRAGTTFERVAAMIDSGDLGDSCDGWKKW